MKYFHDCSIASLSVFIYPDSAYFNEISTVKFITNCIRGLKKLQIDFDTSIKDHTNIELYNSQFNTFFQNNLDLEDISLGTSVNRHEAEKK